VTCIGRATQLRSADADAVSTMLNALSAGSADRSEFLAIQPELVEGTRFSGLCLPGNVAQLTTRSVAPTS
jgi:hypothetical protein